MDEQKQETEQTERLIERMQKIRQQIQRKSRWARSPLDWYLLWQTRKAEHYLQESLPASQHAEANRDEEDDSASYYFFIFQLAPSIPIQISFQLPFSRHRISIGKDSVGRLRRQVQHNPDDVQVHIRLAAHLLSEQPLLQAQVSEAAQHLRAALQLMPSDEEMGDTIQQKAMVHKFLGDALIVMGERVQAREHWERAIDLDPAPPPYGFSGPALEMLHKYPLPDYPTA